MKPTPKYPTPSADRPPRAKKSLGQHFLADKRVVNRILRAAEVSQDDLVLEIGPGRGILTRELVAQAGRVIAVELDHTLAETLSQEFADLEHVDVIEADAREVDIDSLLPAGRAYKVVANLPYYAASPIIRRFLESRRKPDLMVVMVQREVARNMAAHPGKMSVLSVATQLYGKPRVVCSVPPRSFRPAPKVTSAVVRIDVYPRPIIDVDSESRFFELVRAGFSSRRKQIHNSLAQGLSITKEAVETVLAESGIDPRRRAETLDMEEWGTLYRAYREVSPT